MTVLPNGGGRRWLERGVENLLDLAEKDLDDMHARILAATRNVRHHAPTHSNISTPSMKSTSQWR